MDEPVIVAFDGAVFRAHTTITAHDRHTLKQVLVHHHDYEQQLLLPGDTLRLLYTLSTASVLNTDLIDALDLLREGEIPLSDEELDEIEDY